MTTTSPLPARRRRHAQLICALTDLIGACASAAGEVYRPIATAPPEQEAVAVSRLSIVQLSLTAGTILDDARAKDDARWPASVVREQEAARRTYAARCAIAQAEDALDPAEAETGIGVPLPTAEQAAAIDLADAGDEVAAAWRDDPAEAAGLVLELTDGGELTVDEVLDGAVDSAVGPGLLALAAAREEADPTMAAELCLEAVSHLALAVRLAAVDLD